MLLILILLRLGLRRCFSRVDSWGWRCLQRLSRTQDVDGILDQLLEIIENITLIPFLLALQVLSPPSHGGMFQPGLHDFCQCIRIVELLTLKHGLRLTFCLHQFCIKCKMGLVVSFRYRFSRFQFPYNRYHRVRIPTKEKAQLGDDVIVGRV